MKTEEKTSLKKILMDDKIQMKIDVEKELILLKNNFEKTIEKKFNWALAYFYFLCFSIFLINFFDHMPTDIMMLLSYFILWVILYPLIWLSQIQKNRKLSLVKKVQVAGEYFWMSIFTTVLFLILILIKVIIALTKFKTELNFWYYYGTVIFTITLICFGIKRLSIKMAKIYDPEWFE